jgi:hypothetical protein
MVTAQYFPEARPRKVGPCTPGERHVMLGNAGSPTPPPTPKRPNDGSVTFVRRSDRARPSARAPAWAACPPEMPSDDRGMGLRAAGDRVPGDSGVVLAQADPRPA